MTCSKKWILKKNNFFLVVATILLLSAYFAIFGRFFPNKHGCLGHDYAYFLPALLDGYFWYHANGLWKIPWFTPSFCGGSLNYANVQSCFYTLPQLFTLITNPLTTVRLTFLLFAGLGLLGFYLLLRRAFFFSQPVSLLGASIFLFNGFYTHRMLIGHFGDHSFMLLPFISFVLLRPLPPEKNARLWQLSFDCLVGGILWSYMVQSGFGPYLIPVIIAIVVLGLIHGVLHGRLSHFWFRWCGAGLTSILLCSSKLMAIYYLMSNFPRNTYKLPGARDFLAATWLMLKSLFVSPAFDPGRIELLTNIQWHLDRHEFEYSLTFIPLLLLLGGCWKIWQRIKTKGFSLGLNRAQWIQTGTIVLLLILPVALNTYSPRWNSFLKHLPIIKSSSTLIRWFIIYIPVVILAAALVVEKTAILQKYQLIVLIFCVSVVVTLNVFTDREFYHQQSYNPEEIVRSYHKVKAGLWTPEIKSIGVYRNQEGRAIIPSYCNNMLVHGASSLLCYEALFGYRLEALPFKTLHPGPVLAEKDGVLNIKNPACYVWPEANNCEPGDQFTSEQKEDAKAFVNYRPYHFQMPFTQKIANWINGTALISAFLFLIIYAGKAITRHFYHG